LKGQRGEGEMCRGRGKLFKKKAVNCGRTARGTREEKHPLKSRSVEKSQEDRIRLPKAMGGRSVNKSKDIWSGTGGLHMAERGGQ